MPITLGLSLLLRELSLDAAGVGYAVASGALTSAAVLGGIWLVIAAKPARRESPR